MATEFRLPIDSLLTGSATPLSGAFLYFYATGTSTPLNTYSNDALTTPNSNPVVLNSEGRHGAIFLQALDYKIILKTAAGVQVGASMDPVHGATDVSLLTTVATIAALKVIVPIANALVYVRGYYADGDGGEGFFRATISNPGADNGGTIIHSNTAGFYYVRQLTGEGLHPEWFGAKGDGSTNDAVALQACIDAARSLGQCRVELGINKTYLTNTQINASGVSIWGQSDIGGKIKRGSSMTDAITVLLDGSTSGGAARMSYRNFQIDGNTAGNANANVALVLKGNVINNVFETIQIKNSKTGGLKCVLDSASRPNVNVFTNIQIIDGDGYGAEIAAGTNLNFKTLDIENVAGIGLNISGADEAPGPLTFTNFNIENTGDGNIDAVVVGNATRAANVSLANGNVQNYGNSAGTLGNGINVLNGNFAFIDGVDINPRAGTSISGHRRILINSNSINTSWKNLAWIFGTDIEDNSVRSHGLEFIHIFNGTAIAAGETWHFGPGAGTGSATYSKRRSAWLGGGLVQLMYAECATLPGGTEQYSVDFMKNSSTSGLQCVLTNANGGIVNQTLQVNMDQLDNWTIRVIATGAAVTLPVGELHVTLGVRK